MTAAVRHQLICIDPLTAFIALADARALLWQAGEIDLYQAVDELQAARRARWPRRQARAGGGVGDSGQSVWGCS
jgi:hypothetical protein